MSGQGEGNYPIETLYINGDQFEALRKEDDMLYIQDEDLRLAQKHLGQDYSKDISVDNYAYSTDTWDLRSHWLDEVGNRMNVYNPAMKNSPVKVVRSHNHIYIYVFYHLSGRYNLITEHLGEKSPWEVIEKGFCMWANEGKLFPNNHKSEQFGNYAGVQVHVNCAFTVKEPSLTVEIDYGDGVSHSTIDTDDWRINNVGSIDMVIGLSKDINKFVCEVAHEFGHILGLGDAYEKGFTPEPIRTLEVNYFDIMRSWDVRKSYGSKVTANDVEMVWEAWKRNAMQYFVNRSWFSSDKSEVVRDKEEIRN